MRSVSCSLLGRNGGEEVFIAAANNLGRVFIWSRMGGGGGGGGNEIAPVAKIQAHREYITKCVYSPDGSLLATASSDGTAKLWRIDDEHPTEEPFLGHQRKVELVRSLGGHSKWIWDCAWSADSAYLVTGSSDNSARLWEVESGEAISIFTGHTKAITSVALNDHPT